MNLTPQQVARKIAAAASDKKARDILRFWKTIAENIFSPRYRYI